MAHIPVRPYSHSNVQTSQQMPPSFSMPPPPVPTYPSGPAAVRRNTISGVEPMRIDTAQAMPVLLFGSASL